MKIPVIFENVELKGLRNDKNRMEKNINHLHYSRPDSFNQ